MVQQKFRTEIAGETKVFKSGATNIISTLQELEQSLDRVFPRSMDITIETKSTEHIVMDKDRQKLELDITQEFEVADGEATLIIDETK
jgi:hypothetical protein